MPGTAREARCAPRRFGGSGAGSSPSSVESGFGHGTSRTVGGGGLPCGRTPGSHGGVSRRGGAATDAASSSRAIDVIIGEVPAADDPTVLLWTARCSDLDHDLLGKFETRADAEQARDDHLRVAHPATE